MKDLRFPRPEDFDLQKHLSKSFGVYQGDGEVCVTVRFLPSVARYVEESTWHPSQKLTKQRDGSLIAEFTLDGTEEIKRWIMSFGKHARVLEPASLRLEIIEELTCSLTAQDSNGSDIPRKRPSAAPSCKA
jgi:proteasome accessory factor B